MQMKIPSYSRLTRPADVIEMPKRASMTMLNVNFIGSERRSKEQEICKKTSEKNYNKITYHGKVNAVTGISHFQNNNRSYFDLFRCTIFFSSFKNKALLYINMGCFPRYDLDRPTLLWL